MKHLTLFLALLAVVAFVPSANATMSIYYEIGAGPILLCATGPDSGPPNLGGVGSTDPTGCVFSGSGVSVALVTSSSNSPGTPGLADQFGTTVEVQSSATTTVKIWLTAQDFSMPVIKPTEYQNGLTLNGILSNTGETGTLHTCVDNTNGTAGPASFLGCSGGSLSQTLSNSGAATTSGTIFGAANQVATYSLEQLLTLSLKAGNDFNVSTSQSLSVPEPAGIVLLGTALLGIATLVRRKKATRA
jgi:hypothetical protein